MSRTAADCVLCHEEPAADHFGWCDRCATLYDQPDDHPDDPEDRLLVDQLLTHLFHATHQYDENAPDAHTDDEPDEEADA